jgi:hypothetical protein
MYDRLNESHFQGRLPRYGIRTNGGPKDYWGLCDNKKKTIYLATEILSDREKTRRIMLHEMCHVGIPYHAGRWTTRMRKLEGQGESWIKAELDPQVPVNGPMVSYNEFAHSVATSLDDMALDWKGVGPVRKAVTALSRQSGNFGFGISPYELLRTFPWIPTRWARAKNEAKSLYTAHEEGLEKLDQLRKTCRRGH